MASRASHADRTQTHSAAVVANLDPRTAYLGDDLYIPKAGCAIPMSILRVRLTFQISDTEERSLLEETDTHWVLPRYALPAHELKKWGVQPQVIIPRAYPTCVWRPKVSTTLRDASQVAAWAALQQSDSGILSLACGKGKTVMALMYAAWRGVPTLVVAPQNAILENWVLELEERFEGAKHAHASKKDPWPLTDVCFITVARLAKACKDGAVPYEFWRHYGLVIFDECHHLSAAFFVHAVHGVSGHRLGLSATTRRSDRLQAIFTAHIGPVFYEDLTQELSPHVYVVELDTVLTDEERADTLDSTGMVHMGRLRAVLGKNVERNDRILRIVRAHREKGRIGFVLTHSVEHAKLLPTLFGASAGCITGETEDRLHELKEYPTVFATVGVAAEALNRPDLDTCYFCTPFAAQDQDGHVVATTLVQGAGRVLRPTPGKKPEVYIFNDINIPECRALVRTLAIACKKLGWRIERWNQTTPTSVSQLFAAF